MEINMSIKEKILKERATSIKEEILKESVILEQLWKDDPLFKLEKIPIKRKPRPPKLPKVVTT
jgi:ApbE superfamily uncharacterized protein (UPF0280 family)